MDSEQKLKFYQEIDKKIINDLKINNIKNRRINKIKNIFKT